MNRAEIIDRVFQAMVTGEVKYKLIRVPILGSGLFLDFQNGLIAGEVKEEHG